ncbi:hypothetical protein BKA70DRAFT_1334515 [Coprinopsis sp. MPI-PUGE-AT-0042]|nr:hypothetical protein BKA70DRAFT_1334515 [Coprinopsis sp. MPI-PUGE-AT-0042]
MFGSLLMDHHIVATSFACAVALSSTGRFGQITGNLVGPVLLLVGGETMKWKRNIFGTFCLSFFLSKCLITSSRRPQCVDTAI